ncbi:ABC transporter permease [Pelagicoccus sp. SDUM812003]|uniref:ABC transporter permease n=1 Tax=Pelagicoccus sp. SDUM812003 TaxID=3041267 RepID=UPI00280E6DF7|nr:ABC transporter permease [Pelagicoccus sp. SDUM812003]MDQ8203011.1 ABC transporter permease [Pelagicoccus sp. SDUM812003]
MRLSPNLATEQTAPRSLWREALRRLADNRLAMMGLGFFIFVTLFSFAGPLVYHVSPDRQVLALDSTLPFTTAELVEVRFDPEKETPDEITTVEDFAEVYALDPQSDVAALSTGEPQLINGILFTPTTSFHLLGTDIKGRDMLARLMRGGRISLSVGFLATLTALLIGVTYGSISGYIGGRLDAFMMRCVDILYALPFLIFVILLMVLFEDFEYKILLVFIAIGAVEWLTMARIVRGQVIHLKDQDFVAAAKATGVSTFHIITRHIAPNLLGPVVVYATLLVPAVILLESILSFLGLGMQAGTESWGSLIQEGQQSMRSAPWQLIAPSLFFSATLFSMNFLGDGLRDALDVKSAKD